MITVRSRFLHRVNDYRTLVPTNAASAANTGRAECASRTGPGSRATLWDLDRSNARRCITNNGDFDLRTGLEWFVASRSVGPPAR